jgi:signal peptidase II
MELKVPAPGFRMLDFRLKAYLAAALVFTLDRSSKWMIETRVSLIDSHSVIPGFFEIVHSQNRGVVFGLLSESASEWQTAILVMAAATAVAVISGMIWKSRPTDSLTVWGLALVLGGALGNVFDRIIHGRVTDFLLFYIGNFQWPAFNLADSSLVVGCALLILDQIRPKRQAAHVP